MTQAELIDLVRRLIGEMAALQAELERRDGAEAGQRAEIQTLKDEIKRLKGLPPRPPYKPSGMEKATDRPERGSKGDEEEATKRRRGPGASKLSVARTETLVLEAPAGSRFKGYEEITVQDLAVKVEATLYRARAPADDGREDPDRAASGRDCMAAAARICIVSCWRCVFGAQMTYDRIAALLAGLGLAISKRQVARLVTAKLETFHAEDEAVLRAGLAGSPFITVDDTGARHAGKSCFTTHIGSDRFTAFRTGPGE